LKLYHLLKLIRTGCAIVVILAVSLTFFDIYSFVSPDSAKYTALTQFIPSMLSFIDFPSVIFSSFIIVIILSLIAGRSYCSFLCPLGIFQDVISRTASIFKIKKKYRYTKQHNLIRYSILIIVIFSFPAAGTFLILWLDPFSIYGRFSSHILSPVVTGTNNIAAKILSGFNIYSLHSVDIKYADSVIILIVFIITLSISILAFVSGRFYCNTICPVGSLLGLISKISFLRIEIDKVRCIHCGKCEGICKSSCIEHAEAYVDYSRCVSCFNCLTVCPNSSINFNFINAGKIKKDKNLYEKEKINSYVENAKIGRKNFLAGMFFLPSVITAQTYENKKLLYVQDSSKQKNYKKKVFISPPGSLSIERFNKCCTACSLCISKCPSSVLQPAVMQYRLNGIMQPFLDFNTGYCNYDCIICSETCPTGAISSISVAEKHLIQTGKSSFIIENCITYTNGTSCGACSEHCPTKAVYMVPFKNNLVIPEVNQKICIGCGACEYVCPVRPLKAIYVEGSAIHEKAELPQKEKKIIIEKEDFPF